LELITREGPLPLLRQYLSSASRQNFSQIPFGKGERTTFSVAHTLTEVKASRKKLQKEVGEPAARPAVEYGNDGNQSPLALRGSLRGRRTIRLTKGISPLAVLC
jgi:hypothetical protein